MAEPEKIVDFVKREMGKSKADFQREFNGKIYTAEELSALIIKKLKNDAERYLGEEITDAVITVPAYFNDAERTATLHAGQLAGLNVLQIINEPTSAALAYGLDKLDSDQTVFVFDLGGGTFDVTIMRIENHHIRMMASNGDHRLGGKDWDDVIVNWVADEFERSHGENPLLDLQSYQDLYNRALAAKLQLSSRASTTLVHNFSGKSIKVEITRDEYEKRCSHLLEKCKTICEIVMQEANLSWAQYRPRPAHRRHEPHAFRAHHDRRSFQDGSRRQSQPGRSGLHRRGRAGHPGPAERGRLAGRARAARGSARPILRQRRLPRARDQRHHPHPGRRALG